MVRRRSPRWSSSGWPHLHAQGFEPFPAECSKLVLFCGVEDLAWHAQHDPGSVWYVLHRLLLSYCMRFSGCIDCNTQSQDFGVCASIGLLGGSCLPYRRPHSPVLRASRTQAQQKTQQQSSEQEKRGNNTGKFISNHFVCFYATTTRKRSNCGSPLGEVGINP